MTDKRFGKQSYVVKVSVEYFHPSDSIMKGT